MWIRPQKSQQKLLHRFLLYILFLPPFRWKSDWKMPEKNMSFSYKLIYDLVMDQATWHWDGVASGCSRGSREPHPLEQDVLPNAIWICYLRTDNDLEEVIKGMHICMLQQPGANRASVRYLDRGSSHVYWAQPLRVAHYIREVVSANKITSSLSLRKQLLPPNSKVNMKCLVRRNKSL